MMLLTICNIQWGGGEDLHLFVFSDDLEWCKENLKMNLPITFVEYKRRDVGQVDMYLMTLCKHHIIANSSFSWWGAWMDPKPGKIVIAPKKWFKKKGVENRDILPKAWIKL